MKLTTLVFITCLFLLSNHIHAAQAAQQQRKQATELELQMIYEANHGTLTKSSLDNYLSEGADINAKNNRGYTALIVAAWYDNIDAVKILIDAGADINARSQQGLTALMVATLAIQPLITAGADINAKNNDGNTALMMLAERDVVGIDNPGIVAESLRINLDAVQQLITAGADINAKNNDGDTALILAANTKRKEGVIQVLITAGADVNVKNRSGSTALMTAAYNGYIDVVKTLIDAGADKGIANELGKTARDYATNKTTYDKAVAAGEKEWKKTLAIQQQTEKELLQHIFPGQTTEPGVINIITDYIFPQKQTPQKKQNNKPASNSWCIVQ
jgi:ankyrin repeat protein